MIFLVNTNLDFFFPLLVEHLVCLSLNGVQECCHKGTQCTSETIDGLNMREQRLTWL